MVTAEPSGADSFELASADSARSAPCALSSSNSPAWACNTVAGWGLERARGNYRLGMATFSLARHPTGQSDLLVHPGFKEWENGHIAKGVDSSKGGQLGSFFSIYYTHTHT